MRLRLVALLALFSLLASAEASAKDFRPGDLQVCANGRCVAVTDRTVLRVLSKFYWGNGRPAVAGKVAIGAPAVELRFADNYVSGIAATARLDRFRAYGVNCGRFQRGKWYRLPPRAARELRRLAASLQRTRVPRTVPRSC